MSKLITLHLNVAALAAESLIGNHMSFAKAAAQEAASIFKAALTGSTLTHIHAELYKWYRNNLNHGDVTTLQDEPFRRAAILQHLHDVMAGVVSDAVAVGCAEREEADEELSILADQPEVPLSLIDLSTLMEGEQAFLCDRNGTYKTRDRLIKLLSGTEGKRALCMRSVLREGNNIKTSPYRLEVQLLVLD